MRGAESSKGFMSYEIYFELEYYYLWSNCNGWARSAHNNNLVAIEAEQVPTSEKANIGKFTRFQTFAQIAIILKL